MAPPREQHEETDEQEDEVYLDQDDVYEELGDDGDQLMDDDEEGGDVLGDLPAAGPSNAGDGDDDDDEVLEDNSIGHFSGHTASVFAVSAHPTAQIAASGGEDDVGYIWDIVTGEEIVKLTGHSDSVTNIGFSADGEMVATGGMDGKVRVWRRRGKEDYKTWEFLTELQGPDEVTVSVDFYGFPNYYEILIAFRFSSSHGIPKAMSYLRDQMTRQCGCGNVCFPYPKMLPFYG
jgi:ribosome assembly protein SQT1